MKERTSALHSHYVIDGIRMDITPGRMLASACAKPYDDEDFDPIIDESVDPAPASPAFDSFRIGDYLELTASAPSRRVPAASPDAFARSRIAQALINAIWREGHFRLNDLQVQAAWKWNPEPVGSMAGFYAAVESACDYLDGLGIQMADYSLIESRHNTLSIKCMLSKADETAPEEEEDGPGFVELPFRTRHPKLGTRRRCPSRLSGNRDSWVIYIPFDTCAFRLGGSVLSEVTGIPCGTAPEIMEPDYFIDCHEVVRELVEDGIALAGVTVGDGGLMTALGSFAGDMGVTADVSGLMQAYGEQDIIRILFSEVPGVLIEIKDSDFDYLDAELLLQDVAYFPLGHPGRRDGKITVTDNGGLSAILQSLLDGSAMEGED